MNNSVAFGFCFVISSFVLAQSTRSDWNLVNAQIADSISSGALSGAKELSEFHWEDALQTSNDTLIANLHYAIAVGNYRIDIQRGLLHLDSAISLLKKAEAHDLVVRALNARCTFLKKMGKIEQAKVGGLETYLYSQQFSTSNLFSSIRNLSIVYRQLGVYDSALYFMLIADSLAQLSNDSYQKYLTVQGSANIYHAMGRDRLAILKNLELLELSKTDPDLMYTWINLGKSYTGLGIQDSALLAFENSLRFAIKVSDTIELANIHGQIAELNFQLNNYSQALHSIERSLFFSLFDEPDDIIASTYITSAKTNLAIGNYTKAIQSAQEALRLSRELAIEPTELLALEILSQALFDNDQLREAFTYFQTYEKLKSEFNSRERVAKIEELQTKYESVKKAQKIDTLSKENEVRDLLISRQRIILITSIVLAFLLIMLIMIVYRQSKLKSEQRQLILEQSLLRTQMNPHFIFNALTSIQNFVLSNENNKAVEYLAKFGELMREILESSFLEFITLSKEIKMLRNYVDLESARFKKQLSVAINIQHLNSEEILIPPMMLQPFLENSIKHGFKDCDEGIITLDIFEENDNLVIRIEDNGAGMDKKFKHEGHTHAMNITRERLAGIQRNQPILESNNKLDENGKVIGFEVTIKLPLKYEI